MVSGFERRCSCSSWIAANRGEGAWLFRPCEKIASCGFASTYFIFGSIAKPVGAGYSDVYNLMPEAQNER